ncbi:MAG: hypothetical protein C0418_04225 [Coriobacteriaceae bacterium]|nr:hypothetical protein [Coriobacteriaceae bacterium]
MGAAPVRTQATARKCRETPMGRTALAGLRRRLRWLVARLSAALRRTVPKPRRGSGTASRCATPSRRHAWAYAPVPAALVRTRSRASSCRQTCRREMKDLRETSESVGPGSRSPLGRRGPRTRPSRVPPSRAAAPVAKGGSRHDLPDPDAG